MTTAPTPEEVHALAARLEHCVAKWGKQNALSLEAYSAVKMMRRLQAENQRLQQLLQCDTPRYCSSVQRCTAGDEHRAELEARKPLPPTDMTPVQHVNALVGDGLTAQKVEAICEREPYDVTGVVLSLPDGRACIVNQSAVRWFHGPRDFWNVLHPESKPLPWKPGFDCMVPGQEELAIQFCAEIAGPRGQPGRNPDPVRLLEMAEALYKAEADARPVDKSPNLQEPLVDKTANLQGRPDPLSDDDRLRLRSDVARAIWDVMREHEDRCDHALEDVDHKHQVWDCADAAIRAMRDKP